jgi:hypothetical protein
MYEHKTEMIQICTRCDQSNVFRTLHIAAIEPTTKIKDYNKDDLLGT